MEQLDVRATAPTGAAMNRLCLIMDRLLAPGPARVEHGTLGVLAPLHGAIHLAVEHARSRAVRP